MRRILALAFILAAAVPSLATARCIPTANGLINLEKIRLGDPDSTWIGCVNRSFDILSTSGVPVNSTTSWVREGRLDVSTIGAVGSVPAIYVSSGMRVGAGAGLIVDYGLTAGSGTFTAIGNQTFGLTVSSGITVAAGTVRVSGPGGLDASGTGIKASTSSLVATGPNQFSLYTSSGISIGAGTLLAQGPIQGTATGNSMPSMVLSSGALIGSDVHVTGTLEATKLKGDGSQITGIGGGGTVTTQGSPTAGQIAVFANSGGNIISTTTAISVPSGSTIALGGVMFSGSGSYLIQGSSVGANPLNTGGWGVITAFSKDGATQSSGCIVAVSASSGSDGASLLFTSTTTAALDWGVNTIFPGVLLETCAPLTFCRVGIGGIYRVFSSNASTRSFVATSGTRCQVALENQGDSFTLGRALNSTAGAGPLWIYIGGRN